jgi:hemerythrin superfamily protein
MGTMISTGSDVVTFLKEQHQQIKGMFEEVLAARGEPRAKAFVALRRTLAVHETAEEQIVHPAARRALADGESVVEARLREEKEAKRALADLEKLDVDSLAFESALRTLQEFVLAHAEREEREEFERLEAIFDATRLERMRRAAEFAETVAPTRPHPGIESAIANTIAGPFAAMVDRARDVLARKA